ncbi:guanylate kinase [candidate division KSB1 bacterium]
MPDPTSIKITKPIFLVISGPSGSGKTTIRNEILENIAGAEFSISMTTRKRRQGEKDGFDYLFAEEDEFKKLQENDFFLEWEVIHGDYYGTPMTKINEAKEKNNLLIFDVDVKGGLNIKKKFDNVILIYLKVQSIDTLRKRLKKRDTDSKLRIEKRLKRMEVEDELSKDYDHVIVNKDKNETLENIYGIISDLAAG